MEGPYEFRVVEASHPEPLIYLSRFWEKRLQEYVKGNEHTRDLQAPENISNSKWIWTAGVASVAIIGGLFLFVNHKENK